MEAARRQFQIRTELYVIVVLSLGAVPEETLRDLQRLALDRANTAAKRMVAAPLRGSHEIYLNEVRGQRTDNNED